MFVIWPMDRPYWWKSHLFCDLSHGQGDRHYSISRNFMAIIPLYKWKIHLNKHYWSISWWLVSYSGPNWWHILCIRNAMNDVIWWCHLIIQWHITRLQQQVILKSKQGLCGRMRSYHVLVWINIYIVTQAWSPMNI